MAKFKMTTRDYDQRREAKQRDRDKAMFPDEPPQDIDEFRNALARKIYMFIGDRQKLWRGCKEPLCRRQRACLAPRISCSNAPPDTRTLTPEQQALELARMQAQVSRALRNEIARREAEQGTGK